MKNPYSKPCMEDTLPFVIRLTLKAHRELKRDIWQNGYDAAIAEAKVKAAIDMAADNHIGAL